MQEKYRSLKKFCIIFGMLILLFNSVSWGIAQVALKIVELLFFLYLVHWLDPDKKQRDHMKLIFFCFFIIGTGFGGLLNSIILKTIITASTILAGMLYLYSIKVRITFDRNFLFCFFSSAIYLPFAYIYDFFKREHLSKIEQINKQKKINGIIFSSIIVLLILIPLYASGDNIFKSWVEVVIGWILKNILYFLTAIIFCWIPAMLVYSYMKGLDAKSIPEVMPVNVLSSIDKPKMFFNLFSIKAILISGTAVNCLFALSQLIYFFELDKNYEEINSLKHMTAIFSAILLNSLFLLFLTMVIKEKQINKYSISLSSLNIYYAISIIIVWISLCWRYVVTVFHCGLKGIWPLWGLTMLLLLVAIAWNVMGVLWNYQQFIKIICYGATIILLLFTICIPEFWLGKINVMIFNYKYNNNLLVNTVNINDDVSTAIIESQDLDVEYLKTLNEWAIPAFLTVKDIPNSYEASGKALGTIVEEEILIILEKDLTEKEKETLGFQTQDEKIPRVIQILSEKPEYQLPGKKRIILNLVKKYYSS